ncbi:MULTISPECIES: DUF1294 domain-containing protein [unclassified Cryobacterium]|uniref:DUF1294 domain-containing protein n=1 Tax=unclassified Cryobacterium TaxID=2649013 RepID=UPI000CE2CEE5|nr:MULTISPECIES: DUF1294 domain-containing protein [unclassified Cryobacterium]
MVLARSRRGRGSYLAIVGFAVVYLGVGWYWSPPLWVAGLYLAASLVCFVLYLVDKRRAGTARRRVSERTLLLWGFVGGWPGAILAQQIARHKTQKRSFRRAFWLTVVANVGLFIALSSQTFDEALGQLFSIR